MRREIRPKTLQSVLKQANITVEELLDNVERPPPSFTPTVIG